jgi:hypothetical protein
VFSGGAPFTVFPDPVVTLTTGRTFVDAGTNLSLSAATSGGSGGFTFVWGGLPEGCPSLDAAGLTCFVPTAGTLNLSVLVIDSVGGSASSGPLVLYAYPALSVALTGPTVVLVGDTLTMTVTVSGGSPGAVLRWTGLPDGCAPPSGPTLVCTPNFAGSYNITVAGSDSGGGVGSVTSAVSVAYPSPASSWLPSTPELLLIGLLAVVGLAGVAWAIRRRRDASPGRRGDGELR